jgi:hypothetical protein
MALNLFSLDDLGTLLACRRPTGSGVPSKLDDTLRAAGELARVGNAVNAEIRRRYKGPKATPITGHAVAEAAHRRARSPGDCQHAAELAKVLERNLPGQGFRDALRTVAAGLRPRAAGPR